MSQQAINLTIKLTPEMDVAKINVLLNKMKAALGTLGQDIQLIDANELQQELNKLDKSFSKTDAGLDKIKESAQGAEKAVKDIGESGSQIGDKMQAIGQQMKESFVGAFAGFTTANLVQNGIASIQQSFTESVGAAREFTSGIAELQAITGVSGKGLDDMGNSARELALRFGTGVNEQIASFSGILSKFGPDLAKTPAALNSMTESVNTLSKAGLMSADESMQALTGTMLQFGISMDDPNFAAQEMARIMNVMSASAAVGSASIQDVAGSIKVVGGMAKNANLSIEETNGAIQALALSELKGSEAGTSLRNILGYLQKNSQEAIDKLAGIGVPFEELGQILTTKGLAAAMERLGQGLNTVGTDAEKNALLMTVFGTETAGAASGLIKNVESMKEFTKGVTGTNDAVRQAGIIMDSYAEREKRAEAAMEDLKLTMGNVLLPIVTKVSEGIAYFVKNLDKFVPVIAIVAGAFTAYLIPAIVATASAWVSAGIAMMAANPVMSGIVLGIMAIVGAYKLFYQSSEDIIKAKQEENDALKNSLEAQKSELQAKKDLQQQGIGLIRSYKDLQDQRKKMIADGKDVTEIDKQLREGLKKLNEVYPDTIDLTKSHEENLKAVTKETGLTGKALAGMDNETRAAFNTFKALGNQTNLTKEEQKRLNEAIAKLKKTYPEVQVTQDKYKESMDALALAGGDTVKSMQMLDKQMAGIEVSLKRTAITQEQLKRDATKSTVWDEVADRDAITGMLKMSNFATGQLDSFYKKMMQLQDIDSMDRLKDQWYEYAESAKTSGKINDTQAKKLKAAYEELYQSQYSLLKLRGKIKEEAISTTPTISGDLGGGSTPPPDNSEKEKTKTQESELQKRLKAIKVFSESAKQELSTIVSEEQKGKDVTLEMDLSVKQREKDIVKNELDKFKEQIYDGTKLVVGLDKGETEQEVVNQYNALLEKFNKAEDAVFDIEGKIDIDKDKAREALEKTNKELTKGTLANLKIMYDLEQDPAKQKEISNQILNILQKQLDDASKKVQDAQNNLENLKASGTGEDTQEYADVSKALVDAKAVELAALNEIDKARQDSFDKEFARTQKLSEEKQRFAKEIGQTIITASGEWANAMDGATTSIDSFLTGASAAFGSVKSSFTNMALSNMDIYNQTTDMIAKRQQEIPEQQWATDKQLTEMTQQQQQAQQDAYNQTFVAIGSGLAQLAADGDIRAGEFVGSMLDMLVGLIPVFMATSFGQSITQLGPIAGPLAWAGIAATLTLLASMAKNSVKRLHGGLAPRPGLSNRGMQWYTINEDDEPEYIVNAKSTKKYLPILEDINQDKFNPKSFAEGSPLLTTPTLAWVGDNPNFAEAALLEPQIEKLGEVGASAVIGELKNSMSALADLQLATINAINNLEGRFYVVEKDIAEGTNRYNNKVARRVRS